MEKFELYDLSGSFTLPFFEAMSQRMPIAMINELYQVLEGLYERGLKAEAAMLLYALLLLLDIRCHQMFLKMQGDLSLMKDFAGEVLTDLGEILNEYL